MKIINSTKNTILSENLKICTSPVDSALGLLRASNPRSLLFKTHFGIHTFGLKGAIDIVVVNNKSIIVKIGRNVEPNRVFFWNPFYDTVIEFPANTTQRTNSEIGDILKLESN